MGIGEYLRTSNLNEEYEKLPAMSGAEIAKKLGITRQAVSNTLKRALAKMLKNWMKENKVSPFEAAASIATGMDISSDADMKAFFKLFPPKERKAIEADAVKVLSKRK